jgi:hypothetical protein
MYVPREPWYWRNGRKGLLGMDLLQVEVFSLVANKITQKYLLSPGGRGLR